MPKFNTGNPVGSSDPRDLFDNAAVADNLITGEGAAYNDRLGKSRKSWQSIEDEFAAFIAASGYEFVGDYAAGIEIIGYQQVVRDINGEFWRLSGSASLPYTTTGAGLPEGGAFVAVGDAVLRQDLAGSPSDGKGAALVNGGVIYVGSVAELEALSLAAGASVEIVGGIRAGGGSVKSGTPPADPSKGVYITLANGNYWERDINGPWNPGWFGIDPSATDNAPAWADMLALDPPHVHYSKGGSYKFLSSTLHDKDVVITGNRSVVIDCTDAAFVGSYWTKVAGTLTQIENLGATASLGGRSITFASAPSLALGDVFIIHNPTPGSWSGFRTAYNAGEFCKVVSVSTNTVTVAGELYDDYAAADVNVYKLNGVNVSFGGGMKIEGNVSSGLLEIEHGQNIYLNNPAMYHTGNSCVFLRRCYNVNIDSPAIHNTGPGGSGNDYGISVANCQSVKSTGGEIYSRRHSFTTGGDVAVGNVPCRDIRIIGATLSNDINTGVHNADFHGNTEDSSFENCEIYGGATWQGKNNGYINCRIGSIQAGSCIISSEIKGGTFYARDCRFHTVINPQTAGRAVIDVGGNNIPLTADTVEDSVFEVTGGSLFGQNLTSSTFLFNVRNRGTTQKVSAQFSGVNIDVNEMSRVLFVDATSGTADACFFIVDELKMSGPKQGGLLASLSSGYEAFPQRFQKQSGSETVTSSTSSPTVSGAAVAFKWVYPKTPVTIVGRNNRGFLSNRIGVPYAHALSATGLTPKVSSDDATNFSTATTVELHWTASIDEV